MSRPTQDPVRVDVAVVGAGGTGLYAALVAAEQGARVALLSRSELTQSASYWAQGGIAAALAADDSPALHMADTIAAGRGMVRTSAAHVLCEQAPAEVRELERMGVRFDVDADGSLALGLEGGHSRRRIVHAGGAATGKRITQELSKQAQAHERVDVMESTAAGALWLGDDGACIGVSAARREGPPVPILAGATVLATGGMAALWGRTTNPPGAVGTGVALAHAAGAVVADLEFMQFHPTALQTDGAADGFLITEAVRGEGALLLDANGERFVDELAPRDEVALAIAAELARSGESAVGLDLRPVDLGRFPNIAARLAEIGIDPTREPVPVAPASHYTMGGVAVDLDGRSSVSGLYAVGECSCTGLHGANRIASNSLAECFVFGRRAAVAALDAAAAPAAPPPPPDAELTPPPSQETRAALWRHAGLNRSPEGLRALADDPYPVARLVGAAALAREESRGAHQRIDRPEQDPSLDDTHTLVGANGKTSYQHWE